MATVIYLNEFFKRERKIKGILSSNLDSNYENERLDDYTEEAREIIKLYLIDRISFKERVTTFLKFYLELKSDNLGNTLSEIINAIEK